MTGSQFRAALEIYGELIGLCLSIRRDTFERQACDGRGLKVLDRLAADLLDALVGEAIIAEVTDRS